MIEQALIDGDIVAYRCAAACENESEDIALWQTSEMMRRILYETNAMGHRCFLTGGTNFRTAINPEYKANRKDMPKPKWLQPVREHLVTVWDASVSDGNEADDEIGIQQTEHYRYMGESYSVVCSIDKDLLQLPGHNYNFVKGTVVKNSPLDGLKNFYIQLIMGDKSDNIFGYDGLARPKIPNFLKGDVAVVMNATTEMEMFEHVRQMYNDDKRLLMNGQCLWIQRVKDDLWQFPDGKEKKVKSNKSFPIFGSKAEYTQWLDSLTPTELHNIGPESDIQTLPPEV